MKVQRVEGDHCRFEVLDDFGNPLSNVYSIEIRLLPMRPPEMVVMRYLSASDDVDDVLKGGGTVITICPKCREKVKEEAKMSRVRDIGMSGEE
jgi:hypothetical protein